MTRLCSYGDCDRKHYGKGYCNVHYKRHRNGWDMGRPLQRSGDYESKFWERTDKDGPVPKHAPELGACWQWTWGKSAQGYGLLSINGVSRLVHRVSYEMHSGKIPAGMEIDHMCNNRACVNPSHLRVATSGQNGQNYVGAQIQSKTGVRGVTWYESRQKYMAKASLNGKQYYLGWYTDIEEANAVVTEWRRKNMPYSVMDQRKDKAA